LRLSNPMLIKFKYDKLRDEWQNLLILNPGLVHIVLSFARVIGNATLTEIYRSDATQLDYYPTNPSQKSVHQYWRGADMSVKGMDMKKLETTCDMMNKLFPYDAARPNIKTFLIHDIGRGPHLHCQTMTGGTK